MSHVLLPAAVFVLLVRNDQVLMLKRKNTGHNDGKWSLPAGRIEIGERPKISVIREAKEEVGIDILEEDLSEPLVMYNHDSTGERMHFFFICKKWNGEPCNAELDKCSVIKWCDVKDLLKDTIPNVSLAIRQKLEGGNYIEYGFDDK